MREFTARCKANMTTGQNIKAMREKKGMSQQAVADAAGIHQVYLCNIETGAKDPFTRPDDLLKRIAMALKVKVGTLRG